MSGESPSSVTHHIAPSEIHEFLGLVGTLPITKALTAIANLGIADALGDAPATAPELAGKLDLNGAALGRLLRYVATLGVFEDRGDRFAHTALSRLLRSDHPQSMKGYVCLGDLAWPLFGALEHTVRTGRPAAETLASGGVWEWFSSNPALAAIFDAGMTAKARMDAAAILKSYDFSGFRSIADIGGNQGYLLRSILEAAPRLEGVLFDLPNVIQQARSHPVERMRLVAGDFFKDPLPKCDAYVLMNVIHDWDDEHSLAILRNLHKVAATGSKLLLIEMLLPEPSQPSYVNFLDMSMLVWTGGGRERCRSEYQRLLSGSGWRLERSISTESFMAVLEAVPV
jgi:hypothetical protein